MKYPPASPPPQLGEPVIYLDEDFGQSIGCFGKSENGHVILETDERNSFRAEPWMLTRSRDGHLWTTGAAYDSQEKGKRATGLPPVPDPFAEVIFGREPSDYARALGLLAMSLPRLPKFPTMAITGRDAPFVGTIKPHMTPNIKLDSEGGFALNLHELDDKQYEALRKQFPDALKKRKKPDPRLSWKSEPRGILGNVEIVPVTEIHGHVAGLKIAGQDATAPLSTNRWYALAAAAFEAGMASEGRSMPKIHPARCSVTTSMWRQTVYLIRAIAAASPKP